MKITSIGVKISRRIPMEEYGSAGAEFSIWADIEPQEMDHLDEIARGLERMATENVKASLLVFRQRSYAAAEEVYLGLPPEIREKFPPPEPLESSDIVITTQEVDSSEEYDNASPESPNTTHKGESNAD